VYSVGGDVAQWSERALHKR